MSVFPHSSIQNTNKTECPLATAKRTRRLAFNTVLNLLGQLLPLVVGIAAMPFIIRGLGTERFGILGIVWVVFGYFALFDLGLGRATTKFLAEYLGNGNTADIPKFVWTSIALQLAFGIVAALVLASLTPVLVRILRVPYDLVEETKVTLRILAAALPVVLVANGLRAVLEGCQRFDLTNILKIPANALVFVIPAMALPFGLKLPAVVWLLLFSRAALVLAQLVLCLRVVPGLRHSFVIDSRSVIPLLAYGGWVTVASVVNPILIYLDRFLIASLLSVSMVGYYTAPFESITRLWIIPASLATAIFPACSTLGICRKDELGHLYSRSIKYLFVILAPITLLIVVFAREIITFWLGVGFAGKSSTVLQILAVGVFFNSFAHVPFSFLQALVRPDAPAKLLLA
jgi:O-antigen/teichoic acid export membrane protein